VTSAFGDAPHSSGNKAAIVDGLREGGALTISLIAEDEGELVGHVAFSPVKINAEAVDWYRLGPIAVRPDKQRRRIGRALIEGGLDCIRPLHARGCVVLGDPAYYGRFGFRNNPALRNARVPAEYFQQLSFGDEKRGRRISSGILRKLSPLPTCVVTRRRFSSGCKTHPAIRSRRKQPGAGMEVTKCLKPSDSGHELVTARVCRPQRE
jgi:putative acetyltransferase